MSLSDKKPEKILDRQIKAELIDLKKDAIELAAKNMLDFDRPITSSVQV